MFLYTTDTIIIIHHTSHSVVVASPLGVVNICILIKRLFNVKWSIAPSLNDDGITRRRRL